MPSQEAGSNPAPGSPSGTPARQAQEAQETQQGAAATSPPRTEQELAQAFRDLARGENAATALENNLTTLEGRIDELLASFERSAAALPPVGRANGTDGSTSGAGEGGGSRDAAKK